MGVVCGGLNSGLGMSQQQQQKEEQQSDGVTTEDNRDSRIIYVYPIESHYCT